MIPWVLFAAWISVAEAHEWEAEEVTVTADSSGSVTICWEPVEEAEGYQIYQELLVGSLDSDDPLRYHRLLWEQAEAGDSCAVLGSIDGDPVVYVVEVLHSHPTAIRRCTWGEMKHERTDPPL